MICKKCEKEIKKNDRYVSLITYFEDKEIEKLFFHINCWRDYYNDCVNKKVDNFKGKAITTAKSLMKNMTNLLDKTVKSPQDLDVMINKLPA